VYGRGVERITPIGCTAGRTTGSLTVADAKIVCVQDDIRKERRTRFEYE